MGLNFGLHDSTLKSCLQGSSNLATVWFSDSTLQLKVPAGTERSHALMVTVSRKVGTQTETFSYFPPRFATTDLSNAPPKALVPPTFALSKIRTIKLLGYGWDNNGYSVISRMGSSAPAATIWRSLTSINTRPISGAFGSFKVTLTVGVQHNSGMNLLANWIKYNVYPVSDTFLLYAQFRRPFLTTCHPRWEVGRLISPPPVLLVSL